MSRLESSLFFPVWLPISRGFGLVVFIQKSGLIRLNKTLLKMFSFVRSPFLLKTSERGRNNSQRVSPVLSPVRLCLFVASVPAFSPCVFWPLVFFTLFFGPLCLSPVNCLPYLFGFFLCTCMQTVLESFFRGSNLRAALVRNSLRVLLRGK